MYIAYILSLVIIANLLLAGLMLVRGLKNGVNQLFGFIAFFTVIWSVSMLGYYYYVPTLSIARLFLNLTHSSVAIIAYLFFIFSLNFPSKFSISKIFIYIPAIPVLLVILLLFFTDVIIVAPLELSYEFNFVGYSLYAFFIASYFAAAFLFLLRQYNHTEEKTKKLQIKYVFIGSIVPVAIGSFFDLVLPLLGVFDFTWMGPPITMFLVVFIAISITRHSLFNIKVIGSELLVFSSWVFVFVRILIGESFLQIVTDSLLLIFLVITGITLIRSVLSEVQHREELEALTQKLQKANNELKALDQMKDELVSIASHELRTPATAIKSYLWMALNKQKENLNDDLTRYISRAYDSSDRLIDLVNDMLSTSRLEGGRMELELGECDIVLLTQDSINELQARAEERKLTLALTRPNVPLPLVVVDKEKYAEIIINLVGNSLKYSNQGSVTVNFELTDKKSPHDVSSSNQPYVWVHVTDTGQGIAKEDMPRLFKKFGKLEKGSFVRSAEAGGTGLGLYISKGLIELHGGDIWIESEIGKGSTFSFSVRAAS